MNKQIKFIVYRKIIPVSLILITLVYPSIQSWPRPIIDWLARFFFCVWLCLVFWQVPEPYKVRKNKWWKPFYVNRSERFLRSIFFIQIGVFGVSLAIVVWWIVSSFTKISSPFSHLIAFIYGSLFILGMFPAYTKFKQAYAE